MMIKCPFHIKKYWEYYVSLTLLLLITIFNISEVFIDKNNSNMLLYFFSTITQSFSALIALVVMIAIFKMDSWTQRISEARKILNDHIGKDLKQRDEFHNIVTDEKIYMASEVIDCSSVFEKTSDYKESKDYWLKTSLKGLILKRDVHKFVVFSLVVIVASLIDLFMVKGNQNIAYPWMFYFWFNAIMIFGIASLYMVYKNTLTLVSIYEKEFWNKLEEELENK